MDSRRAAAVLGVAPGATKRELARAFRARAKVAHPDASGTAEDFILLRAAFDQLHPLAPSSPPSRVRAGSPWFRPATAPTIDLTDVRVRRTPAGPAGSTGGLRRDGNGLTFDDHLAAKLDA